MREQIFAGACLIQAPGACTNVSDINCDHIRIRLILNPLAWPLAFD